MATRGYDNASSVVRAAISEAARTSGVSEDYLIHMGDRETGGTFNPNAKNPHSSATGLFQFTDDTWARTTRAFGARFGITPETSRFDPRANALMMGALTADNARIMKSKLGRDVTPGELYVGHFMGASQGARLIQSAAADPEGDAAALFPNEAKYNPTIFYKFGQQQSGGQTLASVMDNLTRTITGNPYHPDPAAAASNIYGSEPQEAPSYKMNLLEAYRAAAEQEQFQTMAAGYMQRAGDPDLAPDPNFKWTPELLKTYTGDLDEGHANFVVDNAQSEGQAKDLRERVFHDQANEQHLAQNGFFGNLALRSAAILTDVPTWMVGAGAGKLAMLGKAGKAALAARAGLIAAAETFPTEVMKTQLRPDYGVGDVVMNTTSAMALGAGFGAVLGHGGQALDETFSAHAARGEREALEGDGHQLTDLGKSYYERLEAQGSGSRMVSEATSGGSAATPKPQKASWLDKLRIDVVGRLKSHGNADVNELTDRLDFDAAGDGGRTVSQGETAYEMKRRSHEIADAEVIGRTDTAYKKFAQEAGLNGKRAIELRGAFNEAVARQVYAPNPSANPHIEEAAQAYRDGYRKWLQKAKEAGAPWAKDVPEDDTYMPMVFDRERIREAVYKHGEDGVISVVKQAMQDANPDLGRFLAERYARGKAADAAGEAAASTDLSPEAIVHSAVSDAAELRAHAKEMEDAALTLKGTREGARNAREAALSRKMADGIEDAARKAAREAEAKGGIKRVAKAAERTDEIDHAGQFHDAFIEAFQRHIADAMDAFAERMAGRYFKTINNAVEGLTAVRANALSGMDREGLRELLIENGASNFEADLVTESLKPIAKKGPRQFRRRTPLNDLRPFQPEGLIREEGEGGVGIARPTTEKDAFSVRDLTRQDAEDVWRHYSHSMSGQIAMVKAGFQNRAAFEKYVHEITRGSANTIRGYTDTHADSDLKDLLYLGRSIYGIPHRDMNTVGGKLEAIFGNWSFARFMGQSGIAQLADVPKIFQKAGAAAAFRTFKLGDLVQVLRRGDTEADQLSRDLEGMTGVGTMGKRNRVIQKFKGVEEFYPDDGTTKALDQATRVTKTMANVTAVVGGMQPMTDFLQRWAVRAALQRMADVSTGRVKLPAKILNDMGLGAEQLARFKSLVDHMETDERGMIADLRLNDLRKVDAEGVDKMGAWLSRAARLMILEPTPGMLPRWMGESSWRIMGQFRAFSMAAHVAHTVHNIKMGPGYAAQSAVITGLWSSGIYIGQTYMKSIGRSDQQEYLEKALDPVKVIASGYARSSDSGIVPQLVDTALFPVYAATGTTSPFQFSRSSGLAVGIEGVPAIATAIDLQKMLSEGLGDTFQGNKVFTQEDSDRINRLLPLNNTYMVANALKAFAQQFPKHEPNDFTHAPSAGQ